MSVVDLERRPSPFSVQIAAVIAGVMGLAVAATAGLPVALLTAVGLLGVVCSVWAGYEVTVDPSETTNSRRALASTALVLGSIFLLVPLLQLTPMETAMVYPFVMAVTFIGFAGAEAFDESASHHLNRLYWRSRDVVAVATVLLVAIYTGFVQTIAVRSVTAGQSLVASNALVSLFVLEVLTYLLIVLLPKAQHVLEHRLGTPAARELAGIRLGGARLDELLPQVREQIHSLWWLFALQLVPFVIFPGLLDAALLGVPVVGGALLFVLTTGIPHVLVGGLALLAAGTIGMGYVHRAVLAWGSIDPPRMLASGVGGLVVAVVVGIPSLLVPEWLTGSVMPPMYQSLSTVYGPAVVLLGGLSLLLLVMPLVLVGLTMLVSVSRIAHTQTSGFQVAGLFVLVGTLAMAVEQAPALLVFCSIVALLVVLDLGTYGSWLGHQLGDEVDTRDVEVVHVVGSLALGVVAIGVVSLLMYLTGPISVPGASTNRAALATVLALVGALAFALLVNRE